MLVVEKLVNFNEEGFIELDDFFEEKDIDRIENLLTKFFLFQASKIAEYKDLSESLKVDSSKKDFEKLSSIHEAMEKDDKEALYQVQKFFPSSQSIREIFNSKFLDLCGGILGGSDTDSLLIDGPGLFVNRPNTERLLYKWHSEAHYYPKRRNFLNVWFPIFNDKSKDRGTMSFKVSSHKQDFPFSEYRGFNKDSENKANYFTQYEIPSNLLNGYSEHFCNVKRRGLVIFNRSLVHRSNNNPSDKYSFAVVARVWEPSNDLTISGSLAATPYGGDIGRANLIVK